jgi:hypothetical protein
MGTDRRGFDGMFRMTGLALFGAAMATPAIAQQPIRLDTQMFVEQVTTDINGRPRRILTSIDRAEPGDQVIVVLQWRNEGRQSVRGQSIVRPVPRDARIDLSDPAMQLSIDGGQHWGRMDQLWLPTPLGGIRRAVATDITHIRWTLPPETAPGQTGRLSYRATIR